MTDRILEGGTTTRILEGGSTVRTLEGTGVTVETKTFTLDAVLEKVFTKTFTMDAVLKKLAITKTFTLDAILKKLGITKTFTLDAVLLAVATKTFTLDAVLLKVFTKTFTLDAFLQSGFTKTFTLDAVLKALAITKTFTLDAFLDVPTVGEPGGPAGSSKVIAKGVSLIDMQEVAYKKKPQQAFGNKKLIHPHAELKMIAKFKMPVEGYLRHESKFKLKLARKIEINVATWKLRQFTPEMISRFKIPLKGLEIKATFAQRLATRLEHRSKFQVKQKVKLEHKARFDFTKLITLLELLEDLFKDEPKMEFTFEESSAMWEQNDIRELSFDASSSVVGRVTYTPELQTMEIELNGRTYNYCNVPQRKYDILKGAGSVGAAYNREIKGQHNC